MTGQPPAQYTHVGVFGCLRSTIAPRRLSPPWFRRSEVSRRPPRALRAAADSCCFRHSVCPWAAKPQPNPPKPAYSPPSTRPLACAAACAARSPRAASRPR